MTVDNKQITQMAIVVKDIEKTIDNYVKAFGIERPQVFSVPENTEIPTFFNGLPTNMSDVKIAVINMGSLVLELTEPGLSNSPWRKFLEERGEGVHHVGILVENWTESITTLESLGSKLEHVGYYPGLTYSFVDTQDQLGVNFNIKVEEDNTRKIQEFQENPELTLLEVSPK